MDEAYITRSDVTPLLSLFYRLKPFAKDLKGLPRFGKTEFGHEQ
jgi:hypothetical protein